MGTDTKARPALDKKRENASTIAAEVTAELSGRVHSQSLDRLHEVVRDMDMMSQFAFDKIEGLANLALSAIDSVKPIPASTLAEALRTIAYLAMDTRNSLNCDAEKVGCNYQDGGRDFQSPVVKEDIRAADAAQTTRATAKAAPIEGAACDGWEEGGAAFARSYLKALRNDPSSVILMGFIEDAQKGFKDDRDEQDAFAQELQDALVKGFAPDESASSLKRNPLLSNDSVSETAKDVADALKYLSLADAAVDRTFDLGSNDPAANGRYRLHECVQYAARALAANLEQAGQ